MSQEWPSKVVNNQVPNLTDIIAGGGDASLYATKLLTDAQRFTSRGDKLQFQEIYLTNHGPICLPAFATREDGSQYLVYSHAGKWTTDDSIRFVEWMSYVRSVDELNDLQVEVLCDATSDTVLEACAPIHKNILPLILTLDEDPVMNAKLFGRQFFGQQRASLNHLRKFESDVLATSKFLTPTSLLITPYVLGLGAYFGQVLVTEFGMSWNEDHSKIKFGPSEIDPFEKVTAFLEQPALATAYTKFIDVLLHAKAADSGLIAQQAPAGPPTAAEPPAPAESETPSTETEAPEKSADSAISRPNDPAVADSAEEIYHTIIEQKARLTRQEENAEDRSVKIEVDDSVSKLPLLYEKIRNSLDYQDHNLVFRNAIKRLLSRYFVAQNPPDEIKDALARQSGLLRMIKQWQKSLAGKHLEPAGIANALIIELIRGGYLHNHRVLEAKATEISDIIKKYLDLQRLVLKSKPHSANDFYELQSWLIDLMATEISENVSNDTNNYLKRADCATEWPIDTGQVVVKHLCKLIRDNIQDNGSDPAFSKDKDLQIYLNVYKQLFKYNTQMNAYTALRYLIPDWTQAQSETQLKTIAADFQSLRQKITDHLDHPFSTRIGRLANRYAVYFTFLKQSFEADPDRTIKLIKEHHTAYQSQLVDVCDEAYKGSRKHLIVDTMKCFVYILITKIVIVMALEHPINLLVYPNIPVNLELFCLGINVVFPLLFLLIIGIFTTVPDKRNTENVLKGIDEILLGKKMDTKLIKLSYDRGSFRFLKVYYGILICIVYGSISTVLSLIGFTTVSTVIFLFFFTVISFLGLSLQRIGSTYRAIPPKPSLTGFIAEQFYLPVLSVGKWLSDVISHNNVVIIVLDHFVEGSFKKLIDSIERWTSYMKERREDAMS